MATFHPLDYLSLVRRRKWWIIVPAAVCLVATALLAVFLPRVYRSAATITVSSPAVSAELLKQAGPLSREERIRAISQQLLSRTVLERVVHDEHLAPDGDVEDRKSTRLNSSHANISYAVFCLKKKKKKKINHKNKKKNTKKQKKRK